MKKAKPTTFMQFRDKCLDMSLVLITKQLRLVGIRVLALDADRYSSLIVPSSIGSSSMSLMSVL